MLDIEERIRIEEGLDGHRQEVGEVVEQRFREGKIDIFKSRWREVAECLLGRITSLYMTMTEGPVLWTGTSAPLILRPMIEIVINMAYIAKDPVPRSMAYIEYGLGTAKAMAAKYETVEIQAQDEGLKGLLKGAVQTEKEFIEAEKAIWAVDVNMGDWDGSNVRKRAQETEYDQLYEYTWNSFSACVHSTWQHVGRYNGTRCKNPLHRGHLRGRISGWPTEWSFDYLWRAAKYLDLGLDVYDNAFDVSCGRESVRNMCAGWVEREKRRTRRENGEGEATPGANSAE